MSLPAEVPVFRPRHAFEAQLLLDLLAEAGIPAELQGAALQGAVGDLPVSDLLRIVVEARHAEAARSLVAQWEAGDFSLP